jgi:hypothetical protein
MYAFPHAEPVDQVDQVQIRQLTVQSVDLDVDVAHFLARDLKIDGSLKCEKMWVFRPFARQRGIKMSTKLYNPTDGRCRNTDF